MKIGNNLDMRLSSWYLFITVGALLIKLSSLHESAEPACVMGDF